MMFKLNHSFLFFNQGAQKTQFLPSMLRANRLTFHRTIQHPLNIELFKGTLSSEIFGRYLRDDYFYLHHFPQALNRLSAKTVNINPDLTTLLRYMAKDIIDGEVRMQEKYIEHLKYIEYFTPGPAISSYVAFLSDITSHAEVAEGLCAILPCFKIYHDLGQMHIDSPYLHNNPYKEWIRTYSSPDFIRVTQQLCEEINSLGNKATPEQQARMRNVFSIAAQHELDFFDEAYNLEQNLQLIA